MLRVSTRANGMLITEAGAGKSITSTTTFMIATGTPILRPNSKDAATIGISQNRKRTPNKINEGILIGSKAIVRAANMIISAISLEFTVSPLLFINIVVI